VAEGARVGAGEQALTSGPGVSATEGESALTERVQCQRGNRRLQGSEGVRGVRAVRSRSDGGGPRGSERSPSRSIKIGRGKSDQKG
jgi:hypothetical protein